MFDWEGRILDNRSIMMVKAALPFLDIPVGDIIDLEGLLRAIRVFCQTREQKLIDMILSFFMMKRMMSIMSVMNEAQNSERGMEGMFDLIKSQIPKEQQDMFEMMSMMMSMSEMGDGGTDDFGEVKNVGDEDDCSPEAEDVDTGEQPIPEIWRRIAENMGEGIINDRPE